MKVTKVMTSLLLADGVQGLSGDWTASFVVAVTVAVPANAVDVAKVSSATSLLAVSALQAVSIDVDVNIDVDVDVVDGDPVAKAVSEVVGLALTTSGRVSPIPIAIVVIIVTATRDQNQCNHHPTTLHWWEQKQRPYMMMG